jgi:hypothetical protein
MSAPVPARSPSAPYDDQAPLGILTLDDQSHTDFAWGL